MPLVFKCILEHQPVKSHASFVITKGTFKHAKIHCLMWIQPHIPLPNTRLLFMKIGQVLFLVVSLLGAPLCLQVTDVIDVLQDGQEKKWRIQAVSVSNGSFQSRKPLPSEWRGIRDKELDKVSGIDGCVFVHASGFIGGHSNYDGVLKMAQKALVLDQ